MEPSGLRSRRRKKLMVLLVPIPKGITRPSKSNAASGQRAWLRSRHSPLGCLSLGVVLYLKHARRGLGSISFLKGRTVRAATYGGSDRFSAICALWSVVVRTFRASECLVNGSNEGGAGRYGARRTIAFSNPSNSVQNHSGSES